MELMQKGVALYYQIQEFISRKIKTSEWPPGYKIPTEEELSKMFNVSRATIRYAISELAYEGILIKRQGIGTFVADGVDDIKTGNLSSLNFWSELGNKHILKRFSIVKAKFSVASRLNLTSGTPVTELYRLRCSNDLVPFAVVKSYFSADYFSSLKDEKLDGMLYGLLEKRCDLKIKTIRSDIEPVMPTPEECENLKISKADVPTLMLSWNCYDFLDNPIIFTKHIISSDKCKLSITEKYKALNG